LPAVGESGALKTELIPTLSEAAADDRSPSTVVWPVVDSPSEGALLVCLGCPGAVRGRLMVVRRRFGLSSGGGCCATSSERAGGMFSAQAGIR